MSQTTPFSLDTPPSNSLRGRITTSSGDTFWQDRSATQSSKLTITPLVLQGDEFWTKENGFLTITFPNTITLSMSKNTHISFVQTLPTNFVIQQGSGAVEYQKKSETPVAIRALNLLVQQKEGTCAVTIGESGRIEITVKKGLITTAFNDTENISTVEETYEGNTFIYNDDTRTSRSTTL